MIHKKCGNKLVLDCTSLYLIQSPSIKITTKGITPGVIQIDSVKVKSSAKLICKNCGESFSTKEEYENEIIEVCSICEESKKPSQIKLTDYTTYICVDCIEKFNKAKYDVKTVKDKMLLLYGEVLNKMDSPTLLTILMKK